MPGSHHPTPLSSSAAAASLNPLHESEERFRLMANAMSQLSWTARADGYLDWYNQRWYEYTGTTPETMEGWGWQCVHDPKELPNVMERWKAAIATGEPFDMTFPLRGADGKFRLFLTRGIPLKNAAGEVIQWLGTNTDVDELKRTEAALRASAEFMRSVVASSPDCIKVLDLESRLLSLEAGQQLLGIKDIAPYLNTLWLDFWARDEDRAAARKAVEAAAAGGEGRFTGFFRTLHGEDKWWEVAITPILNGSNQPERLLAVSRDVTQRRGLEAVLIARAEELAQADRRKDEFLAMLAHELRNPLAPLRNASELLNAENVSAEERLQAQRIISRQIENMGRMIDDLLDVSRITEGKIELRKEPVSLEAILAAATSLARSGCAAHRQELTLSLPDEPVFLEADATRLEQIFSNLLGNASKYAGDGCHITLSARSNGHEVTVSVRDDGVGIAPELLPRIFDLFVQASRTLDRSHGGLGIGLTLVQRLVDLHGGSVMALSEGLGKGAEFIVRLPTLAKAPPCVPTLPVAGAIPRRLLIVDDNTDSARSMATLQTRRGHTTRTAFTGPEGLSAAADFLPEVVLLDIGLPGMDGFEVARQIRAMPALSDILLIAMTGYASVQDRDQCRVAGFDEHLIKPVDLAVLREWLASHPRLARR
ncbi:MAG: histidine kinase [Chthoniobacteraceae bacterium]|nr:histidine kinase [Chthoniobacteraceae bacterium]